MYEHDLPPWFEQVKRLQFTYAVFQFHLQASEDLYLPPYKGSALRGGFGYSFRKVCCTMNPQQSCNRCLLNKKCAYAYVFETPQTAHHQIQHQAENYPHPFVIEPPDTRETHLQRGSSLDFALVLIGDSIEFLPYFVFAFDQLGRMGLGKGRGKFGLQTVTSTDPHDPTEEARIYDSQSQILNGNFQIKSFQDLLDESGKMLSDRIKIRFVTPTRIFAQNKLTRELPFELLIRNLLRRLSLLARIHCGAEWELPYGDIIATAQQRVQTRESNLTWVDWERFSTRQERRMKLGGLVGEVTYAGLLPPFLPFLLAGQIVHVGKNTAFGLGKYHIV